MARPSLNTTGLLHPGSWLMLAIRIIQFILAIAALGVTGSLVSAVKSYFQYLEFDGDGSAHKCSAPGRLDYNIFCGVITILALIYLAVSAKLLFHIPIVKYSHLAIDACLFIFWLAAAATASTVFLEDLCGICGYTYYLDFFDEFSQAYDFTCCCVDFDSCCDSADVSRKRQLLGKRASGQTSSIKNTQSNNVKAGKKAGSAGGKWAARKGLDAVLCVLFFITLAAVAYFIWSGRRATRSAPTAPRTDAKAAEPTKDGIALEHQSQPVPAPAPHYSEQQPHDSIYHDQTGFQQTGGTFDHKPQYSEQQPHRGIHHDQTGFQQTGGTFDHNQDPYQAMQPGFEQHHEAHGGPERLNNTYAGV